MIFLGSPIDLTKTLVLDTSALINLHASTYGMQIVCAIPNKLIVPEIVAAELNHETSVANGDCRFVRDLVAEGRASLAALDDREYELFELLTSVSPTLDDGEAATIAIAHQRGFCPVIDERRGRGQALEIMRGNEPGWSLDLLRHPSVLLTLGAEKSGEALYRALIHGRMRIHEKHVDLVVSILGASRALRCTSLPGYNRRRRQWLTEFDL